MDRVEQKMEDWDKLLHGMEATVTLILKDQEIMKSDISVLKKDVSLLKNDVSELKVGQTQLAIGQMQLVKTTNEIKDQQSQMMAILLQLIDRIP